MTIDQKTMALISCGLLMYRLDPELYVYLVHPGGPYFSKRDKGWWTIPKGLPNAGEELLNAAIREFEEETGLKPAPPYTQLGEVRQKGGKVVYCWAFENNAGSEWVFRSNTFSMEWPPKSGKRLNFPEIDKAEWMEWQSALEFINVRQRVFIERLMRLKVL